MITADILSDGTVVINESTVSDSVRFEKIAFTFPPEWEGYTKTAIFKSEENTSPIGIILGGDSSLVTGENECYIPHEVINYPGFTVSVYGIMGDSIATAGEAIVRVIKSGYRDSADPEEPTPTEYEQLINLSAETKAIAEELKTSAENGAFDGYTPQKGIDYFTDADKAELTDQSYSPDSDKGQSGKAVAEAIRQSVGFKKLYGTETDPIILRNLESGAYTLEGCIKDIASWRDSYETYIPVPCVIRKTSSESYVTRFHGDYLYTSVISDTESSNGTIIMYSNLDITVDQSYNAGSSNPQSGTAIAEGFDMNIGDITLALATIVEGSRELPTSILNKLSGQAGSEAVERLKPFAEAMINDRFSQITGISGIDKAFKTKVQKLSAGNLTLEPNTVYGIVVLGTVPNPDYTEGNTENIPETISGSCTVAVKKDDDSPVSIKGKYIGVIVGNYGDTSYQKADAFIGGFSGYAIKKGVYTALSKTADGNITAGSISWNSEAIVISIKLNSVTLG